MPDAEAELALLTEGVTRYGVGAAQARAMLEAEARRRGVAGSGAGARKARVFLRAAADARGRVARADAARAATLYRNLTGRQARAGEAERRNASLREEEGLSPRPDGLFRSVGRFRRMAQG